MKMSLIIGHTGQDGTYLYKHLEKRGDMVAGISRQGTKTTLPRTFPSVNIHDNKQVHDLLAEFKPDEIYYLAARHQSSQDNVVNDTALFKESIGTHLVSLIHFLDGIKSFSPRSRLFYAASAHVFGDNPPGPQNETTPMNPDCIYGITKMAGLKACQFYRAHHGVYASAGILYNHESPLRTANFLSTKVIKTARTIAATGAGELVVGSLNSRVDWGYAPDYVEAMANILEVPVSDDFVVASGETHTVGEFIEGVFSHLGLPWKKFVREDPNLITKKPKAGLYGNSQKLKKMTGWEPRVRFNELIKILVDAK